MALQPLAISLDSFLAYTATVPFSLLRLPQIKGRRLFSVQCNFYFFKPCIIYIHYRGVDTSSFKRIHRGYRAATQLLRCWRLLSYIFLYLHVICVELQVLVNCGAAPELQSIGCSKKGVHVNRWPQLLWNFGQHLWPHYHDNQALAKRQNSCVSSLCQKFFNYNWFFTACSIFDLIFFRWHKNAQADCIKFHLLNRNRSVITKHLIRFDFASNFENRVRLIFQGQGLNTDQT